MTDEHVVLDVHSLANKAMARDLAALADFGVLLHLDKGADLCLISNFTTVEIDELGQFNIAAEFNVGRHADV
jgi:hypothetical protein